LLPEEALCTEVDPVALSRDYESTTSFEVNTGKNPYGCSRCTKLFGLTGGLQRHLRIHIGDKPTAAPSVSSRLPGQVT
jgi:hypothetical protein